MLRSDSSILGIPQMISKDNSAFARFSMSEDYMPKLNSFGLNSIPLSPAFVEGQASLQMLREDTNRVNEPDKKRDDSHSAIASMFKDKFFQEDSKRIKSSKYEES